VEAAIKRFNEAELDLFTEKNTDCCYALQDKVWVTDPDGNKWEVFVVKVADTEPENNVELAKATNQDFSSQTCCN
ncbi:MAG: glyoxalase/bleomycin resistance/dioxygenase family protein, partial [Rivularia sp. (in: cyanobacteria)]